MVLAGMTSLANLVHAQPPYDDIEQDSLGNYHKAFVVENPLNYELYYTNDIGGAYPMDWNSPTIITTTPKQLSLLDLGIYLATDTIFIIWEEKEADTIPPETYYTLSQDYGANWLDPARSYENIMLKFAEFNPLVEQPEVPFNLPITYSIPYAYYLVQFKTPTIKEWKDGIEAAGGIICGYMPKHAFIVCMTPSVKDQVNQLPYIRWVDFYHPIYRIMPGLIDRVGMIELNVEVFDETGGQGNIDKVIMEIQALGGVITYNGYDNYVIRTQIDASRIYDIALIPDVEWIDEWTPSVTYMNNIRTVTGAHTLHTNIPQFRGQGIIGEVKDDGIDLNHPDYTVTGTDGTITDEAHGTCTFGTVFSDHNGDARGMLPDATGYFCDKDDVSRTTSINNLVSWGGVFQSNSWGTGIQDGVYSVESRENDQCVFNNRVTMVYAVGNSDDWVFPATIDRDSAAKNVISVGGIDHYNDDIWDGNDRWVYRGAGQTPSQGPADDERFKPDLCGPFDHGYVTDSVDGDGEDGYRTDNYVTYDATDRLFGGTSFATPVVAGSAGLVYEMWNRNHFGTNPGGTIPLGPATAKALLIANAHQIDVHNPGLFFMEGDGRRQQGWGFVDVGRVFEVGADHFIINENVPRNGIGQPPVTNFDTYYINVQNDEPLKITLAWTDPPAAPGANPALVNDLSLWVRDPDGNNYMGNGGLDHEMWSTMGGSTLDDTINNVENVFIENPTEGRWRIRVIGMDINQDAWAPTPEDDQTYALVASYHRQHTVVPLYAGWNEISLPRIQDDTYYQEVFRSIDGYYDRWAILNNPTHSWIYNPLHLNHLMGISIHVINCAQIDLLVYGDRISVDQDIDLYYDSGEGGWNFVGYPSSIQNERDLAINPLAVPDPIDVIWWYDASMDQWNTLEAGQNFQLGQGYHFHYDGSQGSSVTWTVPNGVG